MYEFSLTNSVARTVIELCRDNDWKKVRRIMVKVGGIRRINPELMSFLFMAMAKGTPAEEAILSVLVIPVTLYCNSCGRTSICEEEQDVQFECPACGSKNVQLVSGLEFNIEVLEVEKD
ncbi:MAG: hydrogenase maturation nickel metallochaperone HypA [Synergistaceae bacterium]|nr:hydrogenase maturation nickel metallochaperone HypA [Synergistaceae bacterium]